MNTMHSMVMGWVGGKEGWNDDYSEREHAAGELVWKGEGRDIKRMVL